MKAFWIDAGYHSVCVEFFEELGGRYEDEWFGGVAYAETAAKAKHMFIKATYSEIGFEYTDKMSIRVLASEGDEKWTPRFETNVLWDGYEEYPWMRGKLTKFGEAEYQQHLEAVEYLATS